MSQTSALNSNPSTPRREIQGIAALFTRLVGIYALVGGAFSLAGWVFDIPILADWDLDGIAMLANAAICAMLCGTAVLLFASGSNSSGRTAIIRTAGGVAATIGALTLFEHLSGISLGIDTLLFNRPWGQRASISPMRMGPPASLSFLLLGVGIWLATFGRDMRRWAGTLGIIVVGISSLSLVGYFFGADRLFVVARVTGIAWQTSSILFLLGLSLAAVSPEHGLVAAFRRDDVGGVLVRRLVLPIVVLPLLLGRLQMLGQGYAFYDAAFGTAALSLSMIAMFIVLLLWTANGITSQAQAARAAETALREREARLRSTFDQAAVGMALADLEGRFVEVNHKFAEILGYSPAELCSMNPYEITHPDDVAETRDYMRRLLSGEISHHACEKRYLRKDGNVVWSLTTVTVIKDDEGAPQRFIGVIEDITARKRAEQALVESEERFARFMQHLPGLAWIKDADGRYVYANDAAEQAFCLPRSQLYGKTDDQVFPREIAEQFKENDQRALHGRIGVETVEVLKHEDGELHHSIVNKFPMPAPDGASWMVGGTAIDITERKRAEEALAGKEARLRALVETAADAIITIDHRGLIEAINPAVERMFGYLPAEVIGQNIRVLMPEPYRGEHDGYIANYLHTGHAKIIGLWREVQGLRKDGTTFPMELAVSEFLAGEQRYFTGIVRDITERKRTEQQLKDADRRKDEFLATLAHELRNPLAPIRNMLEILKRADGRVDSQTNAYAVIERQLNQLVRLVDDLLDVSRISRDRLDLRLETTDLGTVIQQALDTCQPMIDSGRHRVEVNLPAGPMMLNADPVRLTQVFGNLLHNACKYTPPGGRIMIRASQADGEVRVEVADSGVGIAAEMLPRVFEMFAQADGAIDHAQGGLGIGLTLVKRMVELHGGSVTAASEGVGRGSQFTVHLPQAAARSEVAQQPQREAVPPSSPSRRILVVDDNRDSAKSLALLLKVIGHEASTANDGAEAIELAEQIRPEIVLLDIGLPKLNGYEVCRALRERPWGKNATIVALTGWGQEEDRRKSQEAGFDRHLTKPAELSVLMQLLAECEVKSKESANNAAKPSTEVGELAAKGPRA